jgi:hypothetical protein
LDFLMTEAEVSKMSLPDNPFWPYEGGQLEFAKFAGRHEMREEFCNLVGWSENGDKIEQKKPAHRAWVIEGDRGIGKSAFAAWCENFPRKIEGASEKLLVVKIKAPQEESNVPTFVQLLQGIQEAFTNMAQVSRRCAAKSKAAALCQRLLETKVPERFANALAKKYLGANVIGEEAIPLSSRCVIETIRDSTKDIEKLRNVVIVLDDLGEYDQQSTGLSSVEKNIVNLINEFVESEPRQGFFIRMILLTYPGFIERIPKEHSLRRRSHSIGFTMLRPFSFPDTEDLTEKALRVGANCDNPEVVEAWAEYLHSASGGIPDLVQALGYEAYEKDKSSGRFTAKAVICAAVDPQDELRQKIIAQMEIRDFTGRSFSKAEIELMSTLAETDIQKIERLCMTEQKWLDFLKSHSSTGTKNEIKAFWDSLRTKHIVVSEQRDSDGNPLYQFFAEVARVNLSAAII